MNITKRILIAGALFIGYSTQACELTTVLQKHLTRDTARIVESYFVDGTVTLNPKHTIGRLETTPLGLSKKQERQWKDILRHINRTLFHQITPDFHDHAAITYTFINSDIQQESLVRIIPYQYIRDKKAGAVISVTDSKGNTYDFLLTEDKEANMKQVTTMGSWWPQQATIIKTLIKNGFTGEHAQMARFLEWNCQHSCSLNAYGPLGSANDHASIANRLHHLTYVATGNWKN